MKLLRFLLCRWKRYRAKSDLRRNLCPECRNTLARLSCVVCHCGNIRAYKPEEKVLIWEHWLDVHPDCQRKGERGPHV